MKPWRKRINKTHLPIVNGMPCYDGLNRVDYLNDSRSLTARICGDPMPNRSALYMKENGIGNPTDCDSASGECLVLEDQLDSGAWDGGDWSDCARDRR